MGTVKVLKLNTKLKISFLIMCLLPIVLYLVMLSFITTLGNRAFQDAYATESIGITYNLTPVSVLSKMTNSIYDEMKLDAQNNPERFNDTKYLDGLAEKVNTRFSSFVVRRNNEIIYSNYGISNHNINSSMLPEYGEGDNNSEYGVYYGDKYQCLLKQLDFADRAGNRYSAFIITTTSQVIPQIKLIIIELIIAVIMVLVMTSLLLTLWMHRSIVRPIMRLKLATQNIKEGNLCFELPIDDNGDEISSLTKDFEEMRVILKENAEEKIKAETEEKDLIRNISHDLKTPLTTIKGYVEGLLDGVADTPQKQEKYLRTIYNRTIDMDQLIDELTMYSRIDMNRVPYTFKKIDINKYMNDCCEELALELDTKGIELEYHNFSNEEQFVMIDLEQMKRVINNIISNSVKYMGERKGLIRIELFNDGDYALMRISDNGKGISPEDLEHIFERFYRADSSRNSKQGGSGIGLAIVKKVIEEHGGMIWAESKEGLGTTMNIKLKKVKEDKINDKGETGNE